MGFEKGHSKLGGRDKGTVNETTKETREVLKMIISEELGNLPSYIAAITKPEIKAKLIIDLLPFVLPKLSFTEIEQKEIKIGVDLENERPRYVD